MQRCRALNQSPDSLKGVTQGIEGIVWGSAIGDITGDTRCLDSKPQTLY